LPEQNTRALHSKTHTKDRAAAAAQTAAGPAQGKEKRNIFQSVTNQCLPQT